MPRFDFVARVKIENTPRLQQVEGLFDVPPRGEIEERWTGEIEPPAGWNVGLIVGPSGCGKTSIARQLWPDALAAEYSWPRDKSILDAFPRKMGIKEIVDLLSSVGFSSPPAWAKPFRVLSNGEQFRVSIARRLAECGGLAVVDEFTSVVDRTVAQIASSAIQRTVRRRDMQFIACSCHYDILDWLDPDWTYEPHLQRFQRRSVQGRPAIELEIYRAHYSAWRLFGVHHYLNREISRSAHLWVANVAGRPAAALAILPHPAVKPGWRFHRLVCLPDYQGVGIGVALGDHLAAAYAANGRSVYRRMSHPAVVAHCAKSANWTLSGGVIKRRPRRVMERGANKPAGGVLGRSVGRQTFSFRFCGPPEVELAEELGLPVGRAARRSVLTAAGSTR